MPSTSVTLTTSSNVVNENKVRLCELIKIYFLS
jgi:hypothetical protein